MKKRFCAALFSMVWLEVSCFGAMTQILYQASDLGGGRWQLDYEVTNISLMTPIEEFTIWFDYGAYDNLVIETDDPPASNWHEVVWQPEPVLQDCGGYDAKALGIGVEIGQTLGGFSVSFDWLSEGEPPGWWCYEIIDPHTFETIEIVCIPEPATFLFLGFGLLVLGRRTK